MSVDYRAHLLNYNESRMMQYVKWDKNGVYTKS